MSQQIMKRVVYEIDGEDIAMDVEGPFSFGDDYVMLSEDMDLTAGLPWHEPGYTVAPFLDDAAFARFWGSVSGVLQDALAACGLTVDGPIDWSRYHALPGLTPQIHRDFIEVIRKPFHMAEYADRVDLWPVVERVSQICNATLMTDRFNIRVVRPRSGDNNPPHRDVWLDHLRHLINIYAPLAGSNARSSLPIAPGASRAPRRPTASPMACRRSRARAAATCAWYGPTPARARYSCSRRIRSTAARRT